MSRVAWLLPILLLSLPCASAVADQGPEQVVRSTTDRVLEIINHNLRIYEVDPSGFYAVVREIVLPHFDLQSMARRAIGDENWRAASVTQRDAFTQQFGDLMVRTYGAVLLQYRGQRISYLPTATESGDRQVIVKMKVEHLGGRPPSRVDYVFRRYATSWRIVEVTIDGVSIVTSNSVAFRDTIRRYGVDSLTDRLRQQNAVAR